jgi:hypothetical protein
MSVPLQLNTGRIYGLTQGGKMRFSSLDRRLDDGFLMNDPEESIGRYNETGLGKPGGFPWPKWPDILIDRDNLEALVEGILAERVDWPDLVFEGDPPPDEVLEAIEMMIAMPDLQVRMAPEGCYLKSRVIIRLRLDDPDDDADSFQEDLEIESELCLSFTERFGVSPVVDIMGGTVLLKSTGASEKLEPATEVVDPERAVDWGLNGCESADG